MTQTRHTKQRAVDIDPVTFWGAIVIAQKNGEDSFNTIARNLGVTTGTFTRIRYAAQSIDPAYRTNLRTFLSICWWLDRDPNDFVLWPDGRRPGQRSPHPAE